MAPPKREEPAGPDGLLSRVVRFVRGTAPAWHDTGVADADSASGLSRQMLKDMIERKRRNDFVRRREFDMLRKLRRAEPPPATGVPARPSFFHSSLPAPADDRATTLRKIDEIEAQMSQQWWKSRALPATRAGGLDPTDPVPLPAADPPAGDTALSTSFSASKAAAVEVAELAHDPAIEEAAIRFAHGDDAGAQAALQALLAPGGPREGHGETWLVLFDFYRATGQAEAFEALALDYCVACEVSPPAWEAPPTREAREARDAAAGPETRPLDAPVGELAGAVRGDVADALAGLAEAAPAGASLEVCCARLERIDFAAAGHLLNWVIARSAEGRPVHLTEVHRLVGALFDVIGISAQARVSLRRH